MLLAEQIMQTIQTVLQAGVDADVFRGRVDPLEDLQLPAIGLFQGAEELVREPGLTIMDEDLEVRTEVAAKSTQENIETDLNELRRQVHKLMMAADALGLAYVIDIIPNGINEPSIDGTSDQFAGTMVLNWIVQYRHKYTDAGIAP